MRPAPATARMIAVSVARTPLVALIYLYQGFSALTPPSCRHDPSCSHYALEALRRHGPFEGGWLTLRRLARCQPWGTCGYDPVPASSPETAMEDPPGEGRNDSRRGADS